MVRYLTLGVNWLLVLGLSTRAVGAEDTADRLVDPQPTAAQRELVQQLGDSTYVVRDAAEKKLVSQGLAAKGVLMEALNDADLEVRIRVHHILACVLQSELEARLTAFIDDAEGKEDHGLPGWKRYKDAVGGDRDARKLFAEMVRSEASLLSACEKGSAELPQLFAFRVASLQPNVAGGINQTNEIPPQTMATLLLIGSDKAVGQNSLGMSQLYSLLNQQPVQQAITGGKHTSVLVKLLEEWVTSGTSTTSHYGMMLALKYDLQKAALQQAKKIISQRTTSTSMLQYAIIAIGKYGGEEHIPLLKSLLENKTVCHTWSNQALKKNGSIKIEVRDVALVILLRLLGKDPAQYGFKLLRESPDTLYYVYTFGFIEDKEREAAHAKWTEESKMEAE
ncbi:MAG: hypothetical protein H8E44_13510 [Planctomycetes bacterium]|nr:hypothetical protein [Planctomycetota bacterium]MBL7039153.1 hypothetical protein [Pirellulaceae bacterium]